MTLTEYIQKLPPELMLDIMFEALDHKDRHNGRSHTECIKLALGVPLDSTDLPSVEELMKLFQHDPTSAPQEVEPIKSTSLTRQEWMEEFGSTPNVYPIGIAIEAHVVINGFAYLDTALEVLEHIREKCPAQIAGMVILAEDDYNEDSK